jgi:hypothetical protein
MACSQMASIRANRSGDTPAFRGAASRKAGDCRTEAVCATAAGTYTATADKVRPKARARPATVNESRIEIGFMKELWKTRRANAPMRAMHQEVDRPEKLPQTLTRVTLNPTE